MSIVLFIRKALIRCCEVRENVFELVCRLLTNISGRNSAIIVNTKVYDIIWCPAEMSHSINLRIQQLQHSSYDGIFVRLSSFDGALRMCRCQSQYLWLRLFPAQLSGRRKTVSHWGAATWNSRGRTQRLELRPRATRGKRSFICYRNRAFVDAETFWCRIAARVVCHSAGMQQSRPYRSTVVVFSIRTRV